MLVGFCLAVLCATSVWGLDRASDFGLPDLSGKSVKLSSFRGKTVLLNFWASWCPPCRSEMPDLQKLSERLKKSKFILLAVNLERDPKAVRSFMNDNHYTFPVLMDAEGKAAQLYAVTAIPTTFLIDKQGRVVQRWIGAVNWLDEPVLKGIKKTINEP
jgi:peroxiredoxin